VYEEFCRAPSRIQLSTVLQTVLSQRLLPRFDKPLDIAARQVDSETRSQPKEQHECQMHLPELQRTHRIRNGGLCAGNSL
jgi:hypothetical protein